MHTNLFGMEALEKLSGCLAKLSDMSFIGCSFIWVCHLFEVEIALIRERMKNIVVINRVLFAAKDEVNPVMQVARHVVTLQSFSVLL